MRKSFFLVIALFFAAGFVWSAGTQEVTAQEAEDGYTSVAAKEIQVKWKVEGENIHFEVSAPTTGWVSIGFDPSRAMKDADMIFGYVASGDTIIEDHFGTGAFSHAKDTSLGGSSDIDNAEGSETGGKTTLRFTIPIDSGDEYDTPLTPGETHTLLIAHGPDGADDSSTKHKTRGKIEVRF